MYNIIHKTVANAFSRAVRIHEDEDEDDSTTTTNTSTTTIRLRLDETSRDDYDSTTRDDFESITTRLVYDSRLFVDSRLDSPDSNRSRFDSNRARSRLDRHGAPRLPEKKRITDNVRNFRHHKVHILATIISRKMLREPHGFPEKSG